MLPLNSLIPQFLKQYPGKKFSPEELAALPEFASHSLKSITDELQRLAHSGKVRRSPIYHWDETCQKSEITNEENLHARHHRKHDSKQRPTERVQS